MKDLIILMIGLFLAYASTVASYQIMVKTDINTAKVAVNAAILKLMKFFKNLLSNETQTKYIPDEALIQKLIESLAPYNELPIAYTEWGCCGYSNFGLPAIAIKLVCRTEDNFLIIRNILKTVFKEHLTERGLQNFYSDICFQKLEENCYKLLLVYAVSDVEKEDIKKLAMIRKKQAEIIAKKSVKTVVDEELESELKGDETDFEK